MNIEHVRIMNAAGGCKGPGPEFDALLRSSVTEITIGSITVEKRMGNSGDVFFVGEHGEGVNSLGLPNPGMLLSFRNLSRMTMRIHEAGKKVRVSISGTGAGTEEYVKLIQMCLRIGIDTIEINVGCPNIWKDGARKPLLSHDPEALEETLTAVCYTLPTMDCPRIAVKLSPMTPVDQPFEYRFGGELPQIDMLFLTAICKCLENFARCIDELVLINTVPNVRMRDGKNGWVIKSSDVPNNAGGLSGTPVLPLMLNHLILFREQLPDMPLTAVGGIATGHDMRKALCAGASAAQIGTAWMKNPTDARIFSDILETLSEMGAVPV